MHPYSHTPAFTSTHICIPFIIHIKCKAVVVDHLNSVEVIFVILSYLGQTQRGITDFWFRVLEGSVPHNRQGMMEHLMSWWTVRERNKT